MKAKLKEDIRRIQLGAAATGGGVTVYRAVSDDKFEDLVTGEIVGRRRAAGVTSNFILVEKFLD